MKIKFKKLCTNKNSIRLFIDKGSVIIPICSFKSKKAREKAIIQNEHSHRIDTGDNIPHKTLIFEFVDGRCALVTISKALPFEGFKL